MDILFSARSSSPHERDASWPTQPDNDAVLHVKGEVDLLTAPGLRRRLREATSGGRGLLVDLSAVTFMDCAGLGARLEARREMGTRLRLRGLPESLPIIVRVCGLQSAFTILHATDTPAEALRGVGDEPAGTVWPVGASGPGGAVASPPQALAGGGEPCDRRTALDLQEATTNAAVVEQAKGLLMGTLGCDADDAWQMLLSVCRAYRVRVGDLATVLVGEFDGTFDGIADPPLMDALRALLPPGHDARAPVSL